MIVFLNCEGCDRGAKVIDFFWLGRGHGPPTVTSSVIRPLGKKRKKLRRSQRKTSQSEHATAATFVAPKPRHFKPGDRVVVETVCTKTEAEIVWQVGPSNNLHCLGPNLCSLFICSSI
jgi:hypothetical protein